MDWLDLLAVQGTLKSLLQHHSSKALIFWRSAFFTVQLWHPYMTTGKTIALTRSTFVGKVMSLLFNMLSRLVITFLPRSKRLLISWLPSPSAVILEPPQNKVWHCFHCLPIDFPWGDGTRCHDLSFLNVPGFSLGKIQGVPLGWMASAREGEKTRETSLDRAKSAREREREWPDRGCRVWQSLAMLYFLPWLLYPKLVHF